ncbi:glycosyltransferase [Micromonospora profundi]|uniref:Glycosyltransferase n=1 Tax=Micromonospora profundi TaxID=1420889 RepID=A0AAJ6L563_9ACTN|nr:MULTISPECIES: glycosyltransferase [Micromonospora]KOX09055.1 glycosyl transferase family 28 [Micromonospora sp. NRRL B-16802]WLS48885.1 glycosyltransferase [Micromonospora profundi]
MPRQRDTRPTAQTRLLVAVGTDKHRFDRLVDWLAQWHAKVDRPVALTVQHGHTEAPQLPGAVPFLGHDDLQRAMADADLVVCHGGPATILEARRHGHLPIVVPRDPVHGEHVDDHQQLFARRLGAAGLVALCETREALHDALDAGHADPSRYAVAADPDAHEARRAAVARVGQIVEDLVARSTRRRPRWRTWPRSGRGTEEIR